MRHAIGVDIGGGSTKIGLVSEGGEIVARSSFAATEGETGDSFVRRVVDAVSPLLHGGHSLTGVGIGYPGPINLGNLSGGLGNVPGLVDYPLAAKLSGEVNLAVRLENDASAAALAEAAFGAGRVSCRMLMVTAGTGIGVAMVVDGVAMVTSGGCLGDAGHIIVDGGSAHRCRLGCKGCLEALASAEAIDDLAFAEAGEHPAGALARDAIGRGKPADAAAVIRCALDGDEAAKAMLATAGRWMGRAIASWVHTFAPETVVIGGGLMAAGTLLIGPIEAETRRCGLPGYTRELRFASATMGNDAGIIGAAGQMFQS
jgi:glucokinase